MQSRAQLFVGQHFREGQNRCQWALRGWGDRLEVFMEKQDLDWVWRVVRLCWWRAREDTVVKEREAGS